MFYLVLELRILDLAHLIIQLLLDHRPVIVPEVAVLPLIAVADRSFK
jgi:hypothetical protein